MVEFPKNFYWGAATSAYQVEGNNVHADWWEWEKKAGLKDKSGLACRHYDLFCQDFDTAKLLGHNAHRLSVEWSRIEPSCGEFCEREIQHYRDVILALRQRTIEPIVTLHHFTHPLWFADLGGWLHKDAVAYFLRYVEKIMEALSPQVHFWVTINEPMIYVYHGYIIGVWPPQQRSFWRARQVTDALATAHIRAYKLIHALYQKKGLPVPSVSIAKNLHAFVPCTPALKNRVAVYLRDRYFNVTFLERLVRAKSLDFIGVNYYSRDLVDVDSWKLSRILLEVCRRGHATLPKNTLGWEIYPQGFYDLVLRLKQYNLPVFVLENGICADDDSLRWEFIRQHLFSLHQAMQQGVRVLGYLYWSLLDNFEWDKGFGPRFGLVEIEYRTFQRKTRDSGRKFAEVCATGGVT